MQHILLFRWIFLSYLQLYLWQLAKFSADCTHTQALIEMSGILCVRSAVDYFSFGRFRCEKTFASLLTGDAFIRAGFRDASCPPSQGNRMPALLFSHCLPPALAGGAVLETKPKLFLSFLRHSHSSVSFQHMPLPGSQGAPASPWPRAGCPGWGGGGQPGHRALRWLSRLPAEAQLPLNSKATASGLPPIWLYVPLVPIWVLLQSKGRN